MIFFFKNLANKFKVRKYDYSHWDIHALARMMDPKAWAAFDALPTIDPSTGRPKYYGSFKPVKNSFNLAINLLKNGVYPYKKNLLSDADVSAFLKNRNLTSI